MRYGTRVGSLEAALGAPMTSARRAHWSLIPVDRDEQNPAEQDPAEQDPAEQDPAEQDPVEGQDPVEERDLAEQDPAEQEQGPPARDDGDSDPLEVTDVGGSGVEPAVSAHAAGIDAETVEVPAVPESEDVTTQDAGGQRPSRSGDPDALRARVQALHTQLGRGPARGVEAHGPVDDVDADAARRAQLAAWADDDRRHETGLSAADGRGSTEASDASDEDGA